MICLMNDLFGKEKILRNVFVAIFIHLPCQLGQPVWAEVGIFIKYIFNSRCYAVGPKAFSGEKDFFIGDKSLFVRGNGPG